MFLSENKKSLREEKKTFWPCPHQIPQCKKKHSLFENLGLMSFHNQNASPDLSRPSHLPSIIRIQKSAPLVNRRFGGKTIRTRTLARQNSRLFAPFPENLREGAGVPKGQCSGFTRDETGVGRAGELVESSN